MTPAEMIAEAKKMLEAAQVIHEEAIARGAQPFELDRTEAEVDYWTAKVRTLSA